LSAVSSPASASIRSPQLQFTVVAIVAIIVVVLLARIGLAEGWQTAALYVVGLLFGLVLYYASFGFTAAFRVMISDRRSAGIRAQMLMLALACTLFFPLLGAGSAFGAPVGGFVFPIGLPLLLGSFMFGIGMQLGGGCGSGTLFTTGGGNTRMLLTLIFFIAGSMAGFAHLPWWESLPHFAPVSIVDRFGWPVALALSLVIFVGVWLAARSFEIGRHGRLAPITNWRDSERQRPFFARHWPLAAGAVGLAVLNFATLCLAGRPWGITAAFPLWGASALQMLGVGVADWPSWSDPGNRAWLAEGVLADVTSVMDIGLMIGAALAAGLSGNFRPGWRVPARHIVASIIGGLLMGYGARLAYGCNIGAYFSGIASGSLHGWIWIVFALAGNWCGTWLRPLFGMQVEHSEVERTAPSSC
jgi:uncharacterized membrane protein YedE/YeeE